MSQMKPHQRVNDILLGPLERPALAWLAMHMPAWVSPDTLTGIGVLGAVVICLSYSLSNVHNGFLWLASLGFVINWFGDSLDGTLARYRHCERPKYGFFVDHTVDSFNEVLIVLGLGFSPYVRFDVACLALIGYLLMSILVFIRTYVEGVFQISYGRFGPTEIRVILILLNAIMFFTRPPSITLSWATFTIYDLIVGVIALLLVTLYLVSVLRQARGLYDLEGGAVRPAAEVGD